MKTWDDGEKNHLVPLTEPMKDLLKDMEKVNGETEFVFASPRTMSRHINPSSINNHFIDLGYKGDFVGHGVRTTVLTYGQEVLGFDEKVIRLQQGWKVKDRIQGIYDRHDFMEERIKFIVAWSDALLGQGMKV
jgi:integrase